MKTACLKKNPDSHLSRKISALFLAILVTLSACSGSNNTSSTPIPLPNGQNGSLQVGNSNSADCFAITSASSLALCTSSTSPANGSSGVTALGTFLSGSSGSQNPALVVGTSAGTVSVDTNVDSSTITPFGCSVTTGTNPRITAIAGVANATNVNIFAAVGNNLYSTTSSSRSCSFTSSPAILTTTSAEGNITGLAVYNNGSTSTLFGVTSSGYYFSITTANGSSPTLTTTPQYLPNYPVSGPVITGMAIDPYGLVFFSDASTNTSGNGGQVTIYNASGATLVYNGQSYSGDNNGVAMSDPIGIAVSQTSITNSNYCSNPSLPCDYLYLLNSGNIIQQYVLQVPPAPYTGGISINPFNLPYTGCEMTNPAAITSFSGLNSPPFTTSGSPASGGPLVFLGNNGLYSAGACHGSTSYGNNVVSYTIQGE